MSNNIKRILAIIVALVMGPGLVYYGAREYVNCKRLADHGKTVPAQVVSVSDQASGRLRRHTYYLTISFETPDGAGVQTQVKVSRNTFETARPGGTVQAYYLPEDPTVCTAGQQVELWYGNLVTGMIVIASAVYLLVTMKRGSGMDDLAERISAQLKPMMVEKFEYQPARPEEFHHLDLAFYDQARQHLERHGYRYLGDEENITLKMNVAERTFLRLLVCEDENTVAFLYHVKPRRAGVKEAKVMDLECWFSNRQFVTTSNASRAGMFDSPPAIRALHLLAETSWDEILEAHRKQVSNFLAQNPGAQPVKLRSLEDVRRFQDELQRTKAEFRRTTGLSKVELERFMRGRNGIDVEVLHAKLAERLRASNPVPVAG